MMEEKSPGILLQEFPYLGRGRILKVFMPEAGLMTFMSRKTSLSFLSPFCIAEWVYKKGASEISTLIDGSLIDSLSTLRQSYQTLTAAGAMASALLRSQLPAKRAPELYELLCSYFKKLGQFENTWILVSSFRIKILMYEGLLALQLRCASCEKAASFLTKGESVCAMHATSSSIAFTETEWQTLYLLAFAKQFSILQSIDLDAALTKKIAHLSLI